ncbi:MAG: ABC transporter permease [Bacteroidales bacterium]|nr:ABC transporter permease [Bacteroidales bacterium]
MNTFLEQPRRGKTREAQITPHKRSAVWGGTPKILNILGLATALAVFMILMAQVRYDRRYNRCLADSERMFRVEDNTHNQGFSHRMPDNAVADFLDSLDGVEAVYQVDITNFAAYRLADSEKSDGEPTLSVEGVGELNSADICNTQFFDFFGYKCVEGSFGDLDNGEEVVVSASLARKLFPKGQAVGKTISLHNKYRSEDTIMNRKIVAVYRDMPANNSFGNPLVFIEEPYWFYEAVKINQDSIQALWGGPEKCYADVWEYGRRGDFDTMYLQARLFCKTDENSDSTEKSKSKFVFLRATMDSLDPAPVLVKRTLREVTPSGSIYCKLKPGTNPDTLVAAVKERFYSRVKSESPVVRLTAVKDIHFEPDAERSGNPDAVSRFVTNCLSGIAWAVLLIAFLNFANFAIAEAPLRMRRVNTRKVLGESDSAIWWSMAKGYVILSLVAFLIAFLVFLLCTRLPEIPMLTAPVTLSGNLSIILTTLLLSIVVGVVVSIYSTRMVTVVSPDVALKGNYGFSKTGIRLRTLFIGLQFFLASVILTCTLYVAVQNRYLKQYDMGFQTHNILNYSADIRWTDSIPSYIHAVGQLPGVEDITAASCNIVRNSGYVLYGEMLKDPDSEKEQRVQFNCMQVSPNFMEFFGIRMSDGSTFKNCEMTKNQRYIIFNKKTQNLYHLHLNWYYEGMFDVSRTTLIGVAEDFHFRPLFDTIQPLGIEVGKYGQVLRQFFIKYEEGADTAALIREIRRISGEYGHETDLEISTLDDDIAGFYEKEAGLSKGMFILCGIAVLLALTGVAGMLLLEMTYRRPELGLRQIFGSSTGQLLARANGKYALLCAVAFLLSVPVSLLLIRQWLKLFVCHAPIAVWLFLIAYLTILALTVLVVTVQSALSLRFEPLDSVRT